MATFTTIAKQALTWIASATVVTVDVDFLFSDNSDFLFSDGSDYLFATGVSGRAETVWSGLQKSGQ